ncbi:MAG: plasmid pRiA4b ORF-3 family protein [Cyanobacteria bacterium J06628_6]
MNHSAALVYQLKVVLVGISPMIWRRLLVSGSHTLADFHYILQIAMGWSDDHLNRFTIHGKEYGVYHSGGISFSDDPAKVQLADLQLREREKFRYEYDLTDRWQHQLRVEAIQFPEHPLSVPVCITGKRSAPPENCGGPWAFQMKQQHYSAGYALEVLTDIYRGGAETLRDRFDEVRLLQQWLSLEEFDCKTVNRRLQQYADGDRAELFAEVIG